MYEYLSGMLTKVTPKYVVLDNSGVGYLIYVPNPYNYKVNDYCTIWVYQAVREDSIDLYGFSTFEENEAELAAAINSDPEGTGLIPDMFLYELANHEYCITYDLEPTLAALQLTEDEVLNDDRLLNGLKLAKAEYLRSVEDY